MVSIIYCLSNCYLSFFYLMGHLAFSIKQREYFWTWLSRQELSPSPGPSRIFDFLQISQHLNKNPLRFQQFTSKRLQLSLNLCRTVLLHISKSPNIKKKAINIPLYFIMYYSQYFKLYVIQLTSAASCWSCLRRNCCWRIKLVM